MICSLHDAYGSRYLIAPTAAKASMTTGLRPGDPGYDEYLRNGYAAGIEGLWVLGRITTETMIADLKALLQQGSCPKAEQVLRRLGQSVR